jgi:hypothetical protein
MPFSEKFRRWLKGSFDCKKCGREFHTMCFGLGEAICPNCYNGEQPFLYFDDSYWLNRVTAHLLNQRATQKEPHFYDPILIPQTSIPPAIELTE